LFRTLLLVLYTLNNFVSLINFAKLNGVEHLQYQYCYYYSDSDVGQDRYNCPVGLYRWLGPSAIPWSSPVITGYYYGFWVNLWDFFINLSRSLTVAWSISAGCKYDFPHTFLRNVVTITFHYKLQVFTESLQVMLVS